MSTWRSSTASRSGTGCPDQCPNPNVFRVTSNSSEFGIRGAEPLGRRDLRDFPDREQHLDDPGPRRSRGARLVRRILRSVRHVQDGLLPRALRRHPADLRQRPDADELDPRDVGAVGAGLSRARRRTAGSTTGCGNRSATTRRRSRASTRPSSSRATTGSCGRTAAPSAPAPSTPTARCSSASRTNSTTRSAARRPSRFPIARSRSPAPTSSSRCASARSTSGSTTTPRRRPTSSGISTASARRPTSGPGLLYLFVGRAGNGTGSAEDGTRIGGLTKGVNTGSTQWEASYTYVLSGRTLAYAGYVKIRNESNAAYTFNHNPYPDPVQRLSQRRLRQARAASSSGWLISSSCCPR